MKTLFLSSFFLLSLIVNSFGQVLETDVTAKKKVSKLAFMAGEWEGSGWMSAQDRKKHIFDQTETIQFKLDSTVLLIEGLGMSDGKVIHNALAIITFNANENNYIFNSYLSNGRTGSFKAELIDDKFYWYPNENIRYQIYMNEKGQWYEIGEINKSENWYQFFEMILNKK